MRYVWKPITQWPREQTKNRDYSPFRTKSEGYSRREIGWTETQHDLERELRQLDVREVIVQLALTDRDIRIDGDIRANAKLSHPGVIVTFTAPGKGVLTFACDKWTTWQANIRGIAKGLEALRLLDRYGITTTGEQYTGWKELPSGIPLAERAEPEAVRIPRRVILHLNSPRIRPRHRHTIPPQQRQPPNLRHLQHPRVNTPPTVNLPRPIQVTERHHLMKNVVQSLHRKRRRQRPRMPQRLHQFPPRNRPRFNQIKNEPNSLLRPIRQSMTLHQFHSQQP